ncbi:hypothetical protein VTK73DRAFT_3760 [Phialemonium thermophilum]|uniref:Uncharacterized protein n=1 Tax=Phialemonium thermophilum TaxID=223376 RepID=A0ABR3WX40_9PEZI
MRFIRAQIARDEAELRDILKEARKPSSAAAAPITSALSSSSSSSSSTAAAAAAAAKNTSPDAKTSKKQPTTSAKRAERQRRTGPAAPMPYHNEPRLVPAEFEPMSVTEALGAGGRFRQGGGHRASGAAGKWNWEKYGAKGAGGGGSSRSTRTGTGTSSSRL